MNVSHTECLKSSAARAHQMIASLSIPEPLKKSLQIDLTDALRRGFQVDLEQLELTLTRL